MVKDTRHDNFIIGELKTIAEEVYEHIIMFLNIGLTILGIVKGEIKCILTENH